MKRFRSIGDRAPAMVEPRPALRLWSVSVAALSVATLAPVALTTDAARAQQATELPTINVEVSTPSPIVKPKRRAAAPAGSQTTSTPSAEPLPSLPGTEIIAADDAFVPVTIVTDREIAATEGATIADMIANKPGISSSSFAPGASRPIIRGLDGVRIRMQEDGIGSHDVSTLSEDHQVPIDPLSASRVEVVRGPATLRYGSQAIGGVVAVENERIPTKMPRHGISGAVRGGVTSVDEGADGGFEVTAGSGNVVVHADAMARSSDDYSTPLGRQLNSFNESQQGSVGASIVGTSGFIGLAYVHTDSLYGIPGEEAAEASPRIDLVQDKVLGKAEWRIKEFGIEAVRAWFGATDYSHSELAFHEADEPEREVGSLFTNVEQEARVEIQHQAFATRLGELNGALGVQWGHRRIQGKSFEGSSLLDPAETDTAALFLFEELAPTRDLKLQLAGRIESADIAGVGLIDPTSGNPAERRFDKSFTPGSVSAGVLLDVGLGVTARLNGQYVERAPDAAELYSKGIHEATGTFEVGNPDIGVETAKTVEVGFARTTGRLRFDTSVFYTRYAGFIHKDLVAEEDCAETIDSCRAFGGTGPGAGEEGLDLLIIGQRDATFYGAEFAAQYDVAPIWQGLWGIDGQYDIVHAEFTNGENLQRIPPQRLGGGLYYRSESWFARVGLLHAFEQTEIGLNEIPTPGYTLVSAELSYTWKGDGRGPETTIGIKGSNLADEEILNHASFKRREEVLEPGASVRVFGTVKFD